MIALNNNRTLFWILIFLVLVNISAIAGYFVLFHKSDNTNVITPQRGQGRALQKELSLTDDQSVKVQEINYAYREASQPVILSIRETKEKILEELSKEKTDTNRVAQLAGEILAKQKQLQIENIKQFLDLKKVCTPEQTKKLSQIYAELYGFESRGQGKGQGKGEGNGGRRHRWGSAG